ncbi:MAG: hypothetical protein FP831_17035 [Anaerolineae bacterium]|nr:hypothetical protein [Anaerolineae bacterium]
MSKGNFPMAYYYINGFNFSENKKTVESLKGYKTDLFHNSFLPPKLYSREEILTLIKTGNTVFTQDGAYHRMCIGIFEINGTEYLRADKHPPPFDYLG